MSKNSLYLMNFNNHAILSHQYYYGINKKGIVMNKEIPKSPMLSQITCSNSQSFWILHEEGQLFAPPTIMQF